MLNRAGITMSRARRSLSDCTCVNGLSRGGERERHENAHRTRNVVAKSPGARDIIGVICRVTKTKSRARAREYRERRDVCAKDTRRRRQEEDSRSPKANGARVCKSAIQQRAGREKGTIVYSQLLPFQPPATTRDRTFPSARARLRKSADRAIYSSGIPSSGSSLAANPLGYPGQI